ncbi:MAG: hypothetical protein HUJ30_02360 [Gammaproteobacteria bacterium]|nr:hypothetical protein [Gammaproteobacteria bacterium]
MGKVKIISDGINHQVFIDGKETDFVTAVYIKPVQCDRPVEVLLAVADVELEIESNDFESAKVDPDVISALASFESSENPFYEGMKKLNKLVGDAS